MTSIIFLDAYNEDYADIAEIGVEDKVEYCKVNKYNFKSYFLDKKDYFDRTPHWGKINAIKANLKNCDWLFYCDTDSLIVNNLVKLESCIDDNYDIIIGPLPFEGRIATNAFLIKNCKWSFSFLDYWYEQEYFIDHPYFPDPTCDFKATGINGDGGMYFEQSALEYLYDVDESIRKRIKRVNKDTFKFFLIHFPFPKKEKIDKMKIVKSKIKRTKLKWV